MKERHDEQQRTGGPRAFPLSHITLSTSFNAGVGGGACGPYILPMCLQTDQQVPLILQIPNAAGQGVTTPQCRIAGPNPDFSFQWQPDSDDGGYLAQVTVAATRLYSDKPADRAALRQSFAAFREALDRLEQGSQCLIPGGAAVIANRIAASLPLRLDEMLYYYYGFDPSSRAIDLHPGMRLAVDTGTYQFVAPPTQPGAGADSFVSRGRVHYEITASTGQTLSFNAYLQGVRPYQVCPTGSPLGGLADLFAACGEHGGSPATYIRRYYRLIYPNQFSSPSAAAAQVAIGENVTLIGANTLAELNQATTVYVASKTCACGPGSSVVCLSFSGRASVVPEIPVVVQGRTHYVPLGTTFQDVLDTLVQVPPDVIARMIPSQIRVWRYSLGALCGDSAQTFSQSSLDFEPSTVFVPAGGGRMTQFDVPLIQGDAVRIDLSQQQPLYAASTNPFGGAPGSPVGPYLIPSGLQPGKATQFTLAVPGVAGPDASAKSCGVANNPDFALAWQAARDGRGYLAIVTVQLANVWTDDPAKRARLKQSFAGFRVALDQMALSGNCLIPGGAALIAAQTAAALPLRLDELLYYWHSFDSAARCIDLRAGMRIAVEAGAYQFCAPGAQPGAAANGYTAQAAVTYDLVRDAAQRVTFSPFIRSLSPYQVTASGDQAAGLIDLAEPGSARRHYRLVYPAAMPAANASPVPPAASANSVVLLGADALADLDAATAALLKGEALPVASPAILSRYFTGRAAVVPQVQVKIQGELQYVPVGTTLRQVIDRYAVLARDEVYAFAARGQNPVLQRYALPSLQNNGSSNFAAYPIQFQRQTVPVGSGGLTQWDVPLMMGDIIQWQWSS